MSRVEPDNKTLNGWLQASVRREEVFKEKSKFLRLALLRLLDNDKEKLKKHLKETEDYIFRDLNTD